MHFIKELPLTGCAIALGSAGLADVVEGLAVFHDIPHLYHIIAAPSYCLGSIYVIIFFIRALVWPRLIIEELGDPRKASLYSALFMATAIVSSEVSRLVETLGKVGVLVAASLFFVVLLAFLRAVVKQRCLPEPFWFPATVGIAVISWSELGTGINHGLVEFSAWLSFAFCVVLVPIVIFRVVLWKEVAENPSVNILQAPVSLVATVWVRTGGSPSLSDEVNYAIATVFAVLSQLVFIVTLYAIFRRRNSIWKQIGDRWAPFTFPTVANVNAALRFWAATKEPTLSATVEQTNWVALPIDFGNSVVQERVEKVAFVWSTVLSVVLLPMVLIIVWGVTFYFIRQMIKVPRILPVKPQPTVLEKDQVPAVNEKAETPSVSDIDPSDVSDVKEKPMTIPDKIVILS